MTSHMVNTKVRLNIGVFTDLWHMTVTLPLDVLLLWAAHSHMGGGDSFFYIFTDSGEQNLCVFT